MVVDCDSRLDDRVNRCSFYAYWKYTKFYCESKIQDELPLEMRGRESIAVGYVSSFNMEENGTGSKITISYIFRGCLRTHNLHQSKDVFMSAGSSFTSSASRDD